MDEMQLVRMARRELRERFGEGTAGVLPLVPLARANLREELLHRGFVGEKLAIQVARVPVEQHAAQVEHDDPACHLSPVEDLASARMSAASASTTLGVMSQLHMRRMPVAPMNS